MFTCGVDITCLFYDPFLGALALNSDYENVTVRCV
jgi:hypothetical protein